MLNKKEIYLDVNNLEAYNGERRGVTDNLIERKQFSISQEDFDTECMSEIISPIVLSSKIKTFEELISIEKAITEKLDHGEINPDDFFEILVKVAEISTTNTLMVGETINAVHLMIPDPNKLEPRIFWESSDPSVFNVTEEGYIVPLSAGSARLIATPLDGYGEPCDITINVVAAPSKKKDDDSGIPCTVAFDLNVGQYQFITPQDLVNEEYHANDLIVEI